jgi:hypothetical protein
MWDVSVGMGGSGGTGADAGYEYATGAGIGAAGWEVVRQRGSEPEARKPPALVTTPLTKKGHHTLLLLALAHNRTRCTTKAVVYPG